MREIQDQLIFYSVILIILVPLTLLVNGVGTDTLLKLSGGSASLAVSSGCQVGLDVWYISLTLMCCAKLLI